MPQYDDLYIRHLLGQTGEYPSPSATLQYCPDIICWGVKPLPEAQDYLATHYDKTWYVNPIRDVDNFIYVRAKNLFAGRREGRVYLYYSVGGTVVDVQSWRKNRIGTAIPGQDYVNLDAARDEVVSGDSAFVWKPSKTESAAHYCLIAQVTTDAHPNPLPESFHDYAAYYQWLANSPAVGWRNIDVVSTTSPPSYQGDFVVSNVATKTREFLIHLEGNKLPPDTLMQMFCAASGPDPPIDISGKTSGADVSQLVETTFLPPNFSANVTITITLPPGQSWSPLMSVLFQQFILGQDDDGALVAQMSLPIREIASHDVRGLAPRDDRATRLGTFTVQFADPPEMTPQ